MASDELLAELVDIAKQQLRWQRAAVLPDVRKTIERALSTSQLREAYELCDGTRTGTEVAAAVGVSQPTASRWVGHWRDLGIAYDDEQSHPHHLTSLASLGLPLAVEGDERKPAEKTAAKPARTTKKARR